jgi:hypothetical protein
MPILLLAAAAMAGSPRKNEVDATEALGKPKALVGEWNVESSRGGKGHSNFELVAGNSVVLEHFAEPGGQEMLTAYHLDFNQLVLTHYCGAGNQPHMVAKKFDRGSSELAFAFAGGSNIAPGAGHMHAATYRLISDGRFDASGTSSRRGRSNSAKRFTTRGLSRARANPTRFSGVSWAGRRTSIGTWLRFA